MISYLANIRAACRKVQNRGIVVPDDLQAFLVLRRSSLSPEDRKLVLATAGGDLDLGAITTALKNLFAEDELRKADKKWEQERDRGRAGARVAEANLDGHFDDHPHPHQSICCMHS